MPFANFERTYDLAAANEKREPNVLDAASYKNVS